MSMAKPKAVAFIRLSRAKAKVKKVSEYSAAIMKVELGSMPFVYVSTTSLREESMISTKIICSNAPLVTMIYIFFLSQFY